MEQEDLYQDFCTKTRAIEEAISILVSTVFLLSHAAIRHLVYTCNIHAYIVSGVTEMDPIIKALVGVADPGSLSLLGTYIHTYIHALCRYW
jgi:hypothetical protein